MQSLTMVWTSCVSQRIKDTFNQIIRIIELCACPILDLSQTNKIITEKHHDFGTGFLLLQLSMLLWIKFKLFCAGWNRCPIESHFGAYSLFYSLLATLFSVLNFFNSVYRPYIVLNFSSKICEFASLKLICFRVCWLCIVIWSSYNKG